MSEGKHKTILLVWEIKYTLLEKYIYQIIKQSQSSQSSDHGCSDQEIADVLTITAEEVKNIIEDELLCKFIEGDDSCRSIDSDFTELMYGIVEIPNKAKEAKFIEEKKLLPHDKKESLKNEKEYKKIEHSKVDKRLSTFKAKEYYLMINDSNGRNASRRRRLGRRLGGGGAYGGDGAEGGESEFKPRRDP